MILEDGIERNKLFSERSYVRWMHISFVVQHVLLAWSSSTGQAVQQNVAIMLPPYIFHNTSAMYELIKSFEHEYAPETQQTSFLCLQAANKPSPDVVHTVAYSKSPVYFEILLISKTIYMAYRGARGHWQQEWKDDDRQAGETGKGNSAWSLIL